MNRQQLDEFTAAVKHHFGDDNTAMNAASFGAMWQEKLNADEIARLEAAINNLCIALRDLYDEQNDAPLERRRQQWEAAMENAIEILKLYEK